MAIGILFWVLMILWLVFGTYTNWPEPGAKPFPLVGNLLLWVLLALLGWHVFGPALHQ
jgi:hypothetical protein